MEEFEKKIADFSKSANLLVDRNILLAISGGADSIALMFAMRQLKKAGNIDVDFAAGHINHNLRGEQSDADQKFVEQFGKELGIKVITRSIKTKDYARENKVSIETAGRKLRQEALVDIANETGCNCIATAHHMDDNAETLVHRMMRGTGFRGLGGIWPKRKFDDGMTFVRPMLCVTRNHVIEYCQKSDLIWRYDHTNADINFTRNRIRHKLIPLIQADCKGKISQELWLLTEKARKLYARIEFETKNIWDNISMKSEQERIVLDRKGFCRQPDIIAAELIRQALIRVGSGEKALTRLHYLNIMNMARSNKNGKRIELPGRFIVAAEYEKIVFCKSPGSKDQERFYLEIELEIGDTVQYQGWNIEAKLLDAGNCQIKRFKEEKDNYIEWFDYEKISLPLVVRKRKEGDRFFPLSAEGQKKVGKFLTSQKILEQQRQNLVMIADSKKIVWVAPVRASELTKVTPATETVLQLKVQGLL